MERGEAEPAHWRHMSLSGVMREPACCPVTPAQRLLWEPLFTEAGRIASMIFCKMDTYGYCILDSVQLYKGLDKCLLLANTRSML